jgi:hypothetical protein
MQPQQGKYVRDLKAWELPRLEDLEAKLVDELAVRASDLFGDREGFEERLRTLFFEPLREMAGAAVNEIIEYWLKGLADGNDGQFPEFCVEFPYLERNENTESLTLAYCVDNEDGTRTELNRVTLERALMRVVEETVAPAAGASRLKVMASELRALAALLDEMRGQPSR